MNTVTQTQEIICALSFVPGIFAILYVIVRCFQSIDASGRRAVNEELPI